MKNGKASVEIGNKRYKNLSTRHTTLNEQNDKTKSAQKVPIKMHTIVVRNQYTLGHFLAHFTQTCSIMGADEKFLAIFPF